MLALITRIKQLGWKKLVLISVMIFTVLIGLGAAAHSRFSSPRAESDLVVASPTPNLSIACPDRLEHDDLPSPIWIKGTEQKRISGEEEAVIVAQCATPTPLASVSSPEATPLATTQPKSSVTPTPTTQARVTSTATPTTATSPPTPSPTATPTPVASTTPDPSIMPTLQNLGLSFDGTNATGGPGDFYFDASLSKPFLEYGAQVPSPDGLKYLYEFTYYVLPNTSVLAAIDGVVNRVRYQSETDDYEIDLLPNANSYWNVNYDHITNLTVSEGQTVTAGSVIAKAKTNGSSAWFELALLQGGSNGITPYRYCPLAAATASFDTKISNLMSSWETFKGDPAIYNESNFAYAPGCTTDRIAE